MNTEEYFKKYGVNGVQEKLLNGEIKYEDLDWYLISGWIETTNEFKKKFAEQLDWNAICNAWEMDDDFMIEMEQYINPTMYIVYNHPSEKFIWHFRDKIDWTRIETNNYSKNLQEKLKIYWKNKRLE